MTTYPPGATFCRHCGYCLFGLPTNVCPECGNSFDPANPATFLSRPRRRGIPRIIFWGGIGVLVLGLAYGGFLTWLYVGWRAEAGARALPTGQYDKLKTRSILPAALSHLLVGDCRQWQERVDTLWVQFRALSQEEVRSIPACQRLRVLVLWATPLKAQHVTALCTCRELEELCLGDAGLRGGDIAPVAGLVHLKKLYLWGNPALDDSALVATGRLSELKVLYLNGTAITDTGLSQLSGLGGLEELYLADCPKLTDAAVPALSRLTGLKELELYGTPLTPDGFKKLRAALPGCKVYDR